MFRVQRTLLALFLLLCLICMIIVEVETQELPIEAEMLPSEGNAYTTILIRFRTTNTSIGNVDRADIFWDESVIVLAQQGVLGADGSYNYNLTVPNQVPLSDIGNHTIRVDSFIPDYGQVTFNFTFTITEFVPSQEYLELNYTYHMLFTNYTALLESYGQLLNNYTITAADYSTLLGEYDQLLLNFNSLSANYNSLTANYNSLSANYNSFVTNLANYTNLQANFQLLSSNYDALRRDYDSLNSSYSSLKSNYDTVLGELAFSRNLNYTLIASTILLAVASIYYATRKPKPISKARY